MEDFQPSETFVIKELETLKIIADPLRNQICECLALEPLTVRQVADKLGLSPKKLYYHIRLLESHGLIQVAEERVVANIIEKVYRTTAPAMIVDSSLCTFVPNQAHETVSTVNTAILDLTRDDLVRSLEARSVQLAEGAEKHPRQVIVFRELNRLDETRAEEFQTRMRALLEEFNAASVNGESGAAEVQTYALTVVFYPRFYFPDSEQDGPPAR
jgi:DNA-binding transcriptional ArsR family regulator